MKVSKFLVFHSFINYQTFGKLRSLTLTNTPISDELLVLLFEYVKNFAPNLEKLELNRIQLSEAVIEVLGGILSKC